MQVDSAGDGVSADNNDHSASCWPAFLWSGQRLAWSGSQPERSAVRIPWVHDPGCLDPVSRGDRIGSL